MSELAQWERTGDERLGPTVQRLATFADFCNQMFSDTDGPEVTVKTKLRLCNLVRYVPKRNGDSLKYFDFDSVSAPVPQNQLSEHGLLSTSVLRGEEDLVEEEQDGAQVLTYKKGSML